jgi:hypothetical protein
MTTRSILQFGITAALSLCCAQVWAFSQPSYYMRAPGMGGGGGRWFTGTPADGYNCAVCHTGEGSWTLHVEGLPETGYVPGTRYDVRITWPEFTARAHAIHAAMPLGASTQAPGMGPELAGPDMSMLAELTNAQGAAAGRVEMDYEDIGNEARRDEWCQHLDGVPASQLFDTSSATPDQPSISCTPTSPKQRCVLAVQVCGASTLRFGWVAPDAATGPVWFNAGMVATEALNADSSNDTVTFVRRPIYPASSADAQYVSQIDHGCSVVRPGSGLASLWGKAALIGLLCGVFTVRSKRRRSRGGLQV